jgi:hypothetical protein
VVSPASTLIGIETFPEFVPSLTVFNVIPRFVTTELFTGDAAYASGSAYRGSGLKF